jgi:hypothetical protein
MKGCNGALPYPFVTAGCSAAVRPGVLKVENKLYLEHANTKSVDSHRRMTHDGARTGFAAGAALNEKLNTGDFGMCSFPNMLRFKSS